MTIAARKKTKPVLKIEELRREAVEGYIEQLIGLLDELDGDENLEDGADAEPSLGGPTLYGARGFECDLEADTSDDEYTLGWGNPQLGVYERPEGWSYGDGENGGTSMPFYEDRGWTGDGCHIGRKLLRDHVKDPRKLAKALDRIRVSPGYGRYV
jgi:hypothetical protein